MRECVAHGRWAPFLFPRSFGRYQNLLRMILIDSASLVTAPKEARPQELMSERCGMNFLISEHHELTKAQQLHLKRFRKAKK